MIGGPCVNSEEDCGKEVMTNRLESVWNLLESKFSFPLLQSVFIFLMMGVFVAMWNIPVILVDFGLVFVGLGVRFFAITWAAYIWLTNSIFPK